MNRDGDAPLHGPLRLVSPRQLVNNRRYRHFLKVDPMARTALLALALLTATAAPAVVAQKSAAPAQATDSGLAAAIAGDWRSADNRARDQYRHPAQTLAFFQLAPEQTVIEITPGGGWYTEILAPYLQPKGHYIAALVDPAKVGEKGRDYQQKSKTGFDTKLAGDAARYGKVEQVLYDPAAPVLGEPGSADRVLTFRNVHNWRSSGQAEGMFKAFYSVLKPGGVLGVVEHRARADVAADDKTGYVGQDQVIKLAEEAGFKLADKSEINANARDSKDYPGGVWTLPPSNSHDAKDDARYKAIGESDRMTLRFIKPR